MNIALPAGIYYSNNILNVYNDESNNIIIKNINNLNTYNGNNWLDYRLGDTIGGKNHVLGPNLDKQIELIIKKWPNSLIHKYFLLKQSEKIGWNDFTVLNKLLDQHEKINFNNYDNNYIALHLRVGDGISWRTPLNVYNTINIKKHTKIKDIIIFCGSHNCKGTPCNETKNYLKDLLNILNKREYNVIIRSGNSPDDDFFLMTRAKYFIPGGLCNKIKPNGGGYNNLIAQLNNNNVITNT